MDDQIMRVVKWVAMKFRNWTTEQQPPSRTHDRPTPSSFSSSTSWWSTQVHHPSLVYWSFRLPGQWILQHRVVELLLLPRWALCWSELMMSGLGDTGDLLGNKFIKGSPSHEYEGGDVTTGGNGWWVVMALELLSAVYCWRLKSIINMKLFPSKSFKQARRRHEEAKPKMHNLQPSSGLTVALLLLLLQTTATVLLLIPFSLMVIHSATHSNWICVNL